MSSIFMAVQFEFTHAIGPGAGRYVVVNEGHAGDDGAVQQVANADLSRRDRLTGVTMAASSADVLSVWIVGAPAGRSSRLRRRVKEADQDAGPSEVPLLLATFIRGTRPLDKSEANKQLLAIAENEESQQTWVREGLLVVNRAIRAYRHGSRDPYVTEVAQRDSRVVRIGFGSTEGLPEGNFLRAAVLPPPLGFKPRKEETLVPAETTADALAGRTRLLEGEDVLLRAFMDLDHGRPRAALLQVRAAAHLLEVELAEIEGGSDVRMDFGELAAHADELVAGLAGGPLSEAVVEEVETMVDELERALEQWRFAKMAL